MDFSAHLVCTYGNLILYTLELVAVIQYYYSVSKHKDSLLVQAMVYFTFLEDTACTAANCAGIYLVCN
jgi:hypothetical protein